MARLILARHGETIWNAERRYQGWSDILLSARGEEQARALAERLAGERINRVYASDLRRALVTAEAIAGRHHIDIIQEPRLREISFGAWEGLTYAEIQARDPAGWERWLRDPVEAAPSGGESMGQLAARVGSLLEELRRLDERESVLLVAHGGSLQTLLCLAVGLDPQGRWKFRLEPASLSEAHLYTEGAIITLLNDQHHLKG
jgi:alpha-ribazole phosphatase